MIGHDADVVVVGAGFGGSLTAMILQRVGLRTVLVDRGTHPRFAIGESSTPTADLVLRDLAMRYDLPQLLPLTKFGTWQQSYPELVCGLKRGFSYFKHEPVVRSAPIGASTPAASEQPGCCRVRSAPVHLGNDRMNAVTTNDRSNDRVNAVTTSEAAITNDAATTNNRPSFVPRDDHANELLVAASSDDEHSDTHWLRSDVDGFFARQAQEAGVTFLDRTQIDGVDNSDGWKLEGCRGDESVSLRSRFLIDATGEAAFLGRHLGIPRDGRRLQTNSRTIFAHFAGVQPWHELLERCGAKTDDHPFCCDDAALHHILDDGWMWQLRFNNGVTSVGFVLDAARSPLNESMSAEDEWAGLLRQYPSIAQQLAQATLVNPPGGLRRTGRLQRVAQRLVGENWAMLPNTAGFIDPLYSTGIAHTLCGIERLVRILAPGYDRPHLQDELLEYERVVHSELALIDALVSGSYAAFQHFPLLVAYSMLYFAAATTWERRRIAQPPEGTSMHVFLCADDEQFYEIVGRLRRRLDELLQRDSVSDASSAAFNREVADAIAPYNTAGLCDPAARNMYRYTALPG